jgi:catechol-2,3-dioxygenase
MQIQELYLQAADTAALGQFYGEVLGLPVRNGADAVAVQVGSTRLVFEPAANGAAPTYHFAFNIPSNQFDQAVDWLAARLPLLKRGDEERFDFAAWNAHACYFADPAGNIGELIARHNLADDAVEPFSPASIRCVSEIGVPAPSVGQMAAWLADGPGLAMYSGDRQHFAAVGDEHGLFIVVPVDRLWMPDDRLPAAAHPVRAVIAGDHAARFEAPGLPYALEVVAG